jgi:glutamate racemase
MNEKITKIIVTDSGLGGLNIAANIYKKAKQMPLISDLEIIFFNSLPKENFGYNNIQDYKLKTAIFDNALQGMSKLNPDLILIACNTLSVIYNSTTYSSGPLHKVKGIIEAGVSLAFNNIYNTPNKLIILGTPTTITSDIHKKMLIEKGVKEENIISQACKNLESEIQINSYSEKVETLIYQYLNNAVKEPDKNIRYYILLGCTHYEYSLQIFNKVCSKYFSDYKILNPNSVMVDDAVKYIKGQDVGRMVSAKVISRTCINPIDLKNIYNIIEQRNPEFAKELLNYEYNPNSFSVDELNE